MGVYPTLYNKRDFTEFLEKNNVNDVVIAKFVALPEQIIHNDNTYTIYINSIWYSIGNTFYNFELNYYCEKEIEFLFTFRPYGDIETCIDNLHFELDKLNEKKK